MGHEVIGACNVTSDQDTKTSHIWGRFIVAAKPYWGMVLASFLWKQ